MSARFTTFHARRPDYVKKRCSTTRPIASTEERLQFASMASRTRGSSSTRPRVDTRQFIRSNPGCPNWAWANERTETNGVTEWRYVANWTSCRCWRRVVERSTEAGGNVAVFRNDQDAVFALLDRCPHKGGPLSQGHRVGERVACPLHNWSIELKLARR